MSLTFPGQTQFTEFTQLYFDYCAINSFLTLTLVALDLYLHLSTGLYFYCFIYRTLYLVSIGLFTTGNTSLSCGFRSIHSFLPSRLSTSVSTSYN